MSLRVRVPLLRGHLVVLELGLDGMRAAVAGSKSLTDKPPKILVRRMREGLTPKHDKVVPTQSSRRKS